MRTSNWMAGVAAAALSMGLVVSGTAPAQSPQAQTQAAVDARLSALATIRDKSKRIELAALDCVNYPCPERNCALGATQLRDLYELEEALDVALQAINRFDHLYGDLYVVAANSTVGTTYAIQDVRAVVRLQSFLNYVATLSSDVASVAGAITNIRASKLDFSSPGAALESLDGLYEAAKDLEDAIATTYDEAQRAYRGVDPLDDLPDDFTAVRPIANPGETFGAPVEAVSKDQLGVDINNAKSYLSDAYGVASDLAPAVKELRDIAKAGGDLNGARATELRKAIKDGLEGPVFQAASRWARGFISDQIDERRAWGQQLKAQNSIEADFQLSVLDRWVRVQDQQRDLRVTLQAVRDAKFMLQACMSQHCGPVSIPPFDMAVTINPQTGEIEAGRALDRAYGVITRVGASMPDEPCMTDVRPCGDEPTRASRIGEGASYYSGFITSGDAADFPSKRVYANCHKCQPLADQLTLVIVRMDQIDAELQEIDALKIKLDVMKTVRDAQDAGVTRQSRVVQGIQAEIDAAWTNFVGEERARLRTAQTSLDQMVQELAAMNDEIARIESKIEAEIALKDEYGTLRRRRNDLDNALATCERNACRPQTGSSAASTNDTWQIGASFGVGTLDTGGRGYLARESAGELENPFVFGDDTADVEVARVYITPTIAGFTFSADWEGFNADARGASEEDVFAAPGIDGFGLPGTGYPGALNPAGFFFANGPGDPSITGIAFENDIKGSTFGLSFPIYDEQVSDNWDIGLSLGFEVSNYDNTTAFWGSIPGFSTDFRYDTEVDVTRFAPTFGFDASYDFPTDIDLTFNIQSELSIDALNADGFDRFEVSGAVVNELQQIDLSRSEFALGTQLNIGLDYAVTDEVHFGVFAEYDGINLGVDVTRSGELNDPATLDFEHTQRVVGGVRLGVKY